MREILFRGKNNANNWELGCLIIYGSFPVAIYDPNEHCDTNGVEVDEDTIGQYTGLKDKNGVKIFEGDRVLYSDFSNVYKSDRKGYIFFNNKTLSWSIRHDMDSVYFGIQYSNLVSCEDSAFTSMKIEIIGNIHTKETDK